MTERLKLLAELRAANYKMCDDAADLIQLLYQRIGLLEQQMEFANLLRDIDNDDVKRLLQRILEMSKEADGLKAALAGSYRDMEKQRAQAEHKAALVAELDRYRGEAEKVATDLGWPDAYAPHLRVMATENLISALTAAYVRGVDAGAAEIKRLRKEIEVRAMAGIGSAGNSGYVAGRGPYGAAGA